MSWPRRITRLWLLAVVLAVSGVGLAAPAWAHAELVKSSPADGARLETGPAQVELTFTESVNLVDQGLRLLDSSGSTVATPQPVVSGHTVTWPMPATLAKGAYVATWRVVSSDGHPVNGAFSFGIGTAASPVASATGASAASTAPLAVTATRLAGYLALAAFAGVAAFVLWCAPSTRFDPALQRLSRFGLIGGGVATVASLLVQGPYSAGVPMAQLLDFQLLQGTLATTFGLAMVWRLALYAGLAALAWQLPRITTTPRRWLVPAVVVGVAVTVAASGHGSASGSAVDVAVVTLHALTAAVWVGGLAALAFVGRSVERRALVEFSRVAMVCVLCLVATGVVNSVRHVHALEQLFLTRYGLLLLGKLLLVAAALAAAALSRRDVGRRRTPLVSVRAEVGLTVAALGMTALLSMTTPPPSVAAASSPQAVGTTPVDANRQIQIPLGNGRSAVLAVLPATTRGSTLRVLVTNSGGPPMSIARVSLKLSNPARGVGAISVRLAERAGMWEGRYRFPLSGTWRATLTVEDRSLDAVVSAGEVVIVN
ncbi:copper resistance CopC/CopD family protein [Terrabacter sp. BE26]|uniref:copper resistance CopC/CopD family protein n=1 Tax=Terrabacter sp. BE26 TaxID=2898152 RepID=UPI0035BE6D75